MPRPKSAVFAHYIQKTENGKKIVNCKYCEAKYLQNASKMMNHLLKQCKKIPESVKSSIQATNDGGQERSHAPQEADLEVIEVDTQSSSPTVDTTPAEGSSVLVTKTNPHVSPKSSSRFMSAYIDSMNDQEKDKIWCALAKAVYVSGHPLSMFEEPHWVEAFKIIRPALELPSRHSLSNPLLNLQYNSTRDEMLQKISESEFLCLQCDSFTNNKTDSITNFEITTPEPFLYKSVHSGINRHTTEYLLEQICEVIDEVGSEKFIAFTSDNASNVKGTWALIEARYPQITAFGCAAHGLNLLVEDILELETPKNLLINVKAIIKKIRKSTFLKAQFERFQAEDNPDITIRSVHLPVKTRWSTFTKSLKSLMETKQSLKRLAIHEECRVVLDGVNSGHILSEDFWDLVECFYSILSPIAKWLKILEYDSIGTISLIPRIFFELEMKLENVLEASDLPAEEQKTILTMLNERKTFMRKPLHLAAHLLDPREKGLCLSSDEELEATEFISKFCSTRGMDQTEVLTDLANYKAKAGVFSKDFIWKIRDTVSGPVWWGNIPKSNLGRCASMILTVSSTSVATERSFSTYSSIQTNSRNRLLKERCDKLVFLAHNLRGSRKRRREFTRTEEEEEAFIEIRAAKEGIPVGPSPKRRCPYDLRDANAYEDNSAIESDSDIDDDNEENDSDYSQIAENVELDSSSNSESD